MTTETASDRWLELTVTCEAEAVEPVTELFSRYGFNQGVAIEESFTQDPDGDNFAVDPSGPVTVRTFLNAADADASTIDEIRRGLWHLGQLRDIGTLEVTEREEEDWANAWKAHYSVHRVGRRVLVKAPWHDYDAAPEDVVVELDPGMAFGTGLHPSTQLSMVLLEDELRPGCRVLDVGVGSGILSTAAALLGASAVDAIDIEPVAVRSAQENARRNKVDAIVRVAQGSVGEEGPFPGTYDLVVANIIARVLIELAPGLARAVAPSGTLILGGIIDVKEAAVRDAFAAEGFTIARREQSEDWVAFVMRKNGGQAVAPMPEPILRG